MSTENQNTFIQLRATKVLSNTEIATSVFILSFLRDFEFKAGQVVGLGLAATDDPRLYSIASGESDPEIKILYNIKPEGHLTPNLAQLKTGDDLWVTPAFGNYEASVGPGYFIAAGTGIAPFISMIKSGLGAGKTLIHGSRTLDSFYFGEELTFMGDRYVRCCSQQNGPGVIHGRVTQYLEQLEDLPDDQKYYLCGGAEMVVQCREILLIKGIPFNNIIAEIYF